MDTSEEYIKMCERADEIQDSWICCVADEIGIISSNLGYEYIGLYAGVASGNISAKSVYIWLPRQDQLQDMMDMPIAELFQAFVSSFGGIHKNDDESHDIWLHMSYVDMSWEQLWLAFVMKEKYNKVWNGESWQGEIYLARY